jgi:hypothetical protein
MESEHKSDLYAAFYELLDTEPGMYPIVRCKICCLEAPAASPNAKICEMCYEDDFWDLV